MSISINKLFLSIFLLTISFNNYFCQNSLFINRYNSKVNNAEKSVNINLVFYEDKNISSVLLYYKYFGESSYQLREMDLFGYSAEASLRNLDFTNPSIDFYFTFVVNGSEQYSFPEGMPETNIPLNISIDGFKKEDSKIIFLIPSEEEELVSEELFFAISLENYQRDFLISESKVFIDDRDYTSSLIINDYLILFDPKIDEANTSKGKHLIRIELYGKENKAVDKKELVYFIRDGIKSQPSSFKYSGTISAEGRNEAFSKNNLWYNSLSGDIKVAYNDIQFAGIFYGTSEEKIYLQPQNRYLISAYNDWFRIDIGDNYPRYPELILNGKRIRGITAKLNFPFLDIIASYGQITRSIEGTLSEIIPKDSIVFANDIIPIDSNKYGSRFGKVLLGTYSRDIFILRPSYKYKKQFEFGVTYLHSKDDKTSVEFCTKPKENVLFGPDFKLNLDNNKIQILGQAALSFTNSDISNGDLTDAQIDSIFGNSNKFQSDIDNLKEIKNLFSRFITINQFISPLNPQKFSSLASDISIRLNYFSHKFRFGYIYRGDDFNSFGQNYLKTDIAGFNLSDRFGILDDKFIISISYEKLHDNLQGTKIFTTTFHTINSSVSILYSNDLPKITLGFSKNISKNNATDSDPADYPYLINNYTNRYLLQVSYNFNWMVEQNLYANMMTSTRKDFGMNKNEGSYSNISISLTSGWNEILSSFFSVNYNQNDISGYDYSNIKFFIGGRIKMFDERMELTTSYSPSFGDFDRHIFELLDQFYINERVSLIFQFRLYHIPGVSTDSIVGLNAKVTF